jgi:nucleoporin p58/p45
MMCLTLPSAFGSTQNQASTSQPAPLFASLGTAGPSQFQQQQQQQMVPGVKIDLSNIKPTTRYFELHDDLQREIDRVDNFIQQQIQFFAQCGAFMPEHGNQLKTIPQDVDFVHKRYDATTVGLQGDASDIAAVQKSVQADIEDARRVFTAIENQKLPLQFHYSTAWPAQATGPAADGADGGAFTATDLLPYFEARSDELAARLARYQRQLVEIEAHLRTVEGSATEQMLRLLRRNGSGEDGGGGRERVADLVDAMRTFEEAVLRVAARVGEARQGVIECTLDGSALGNGNARGSRLR